MLKICLIRTTKLTFGSVFFSPSSPGGLAAQGNFTFSPRGMKREKAHVFFCVTTSFPLFSNYNFFVVLWWRGRTKKENMSFHYLAIVLVRSLWVVTASVAIGPKWLCCHLRKEGVKSNYLFTFQGDVLKFPHGISLNILFSFTQP